MNIKKILSSITILISLFIVAPSPSYATVSGGTGTILLSPTTSASWAIGSNSTVSVMVNAGTTAISGVQFRLTIPVSSADIEGISITPNTALSNWTFPVKTIQTSTSAITIDFSGVDLSTTGTVASTNTLIATVTVKANSSFSSKPATFSSADSAIYRKDTAADILGTLGNGSYSTTGNPIPSTTPTSAPVTSTPAPTTTTTVAPTTTTTVAPTDSSTTTTTTTTDPDYLPASGIMDNLIYIGLAGAALFIIPLFFLF